MCEGEQLERRRKGKSASFVHQGEGTRGYVPTLIGRQELLRAHGPSSTRKDRNASEAAKATLKARRRKVGGTLLDLSIDIKRLCGEAYPSLSPASLEQACIDHFTDALGATLAKDVIRSKPSTLDKALSEALELEALEFRANGVKQTKCKPYLCQDGPQSSQL